MDSKPRHRASIFNCYHGIIIISGESGASALGALIGLCKTNKFRGFKGKIYLNEFSKVLVINTEGDTDPSNYQRVISNNIENNF